MVTETKFSPKTERRYQIAHLLRRAGFGSSSDELDYYDSIGYEKTVEELLTPVNVTRMPDSLITRYHTETSATMGPYGGPTEWIYRMVSTNAPLSEKIALFWHTIFATSVTKLSGAIPMRRQISMFRDKGLSSFSDLLISLSKDPAMIYWLDNWTNHKDEINENYGRELLELFSMGVGNYSEKDVKECARSFTGWTVVNGDYIDAQASKCSFQPYGRYAWQFQYLPEDHDDGEKEFLGEKGNFTGEDIVQIICKQDATATFISRHICNFFLADEVPVTQWPYEAPNNPKLIEKLKKVYFETNYNIKEMLRVLFLSEEFKDRSNFYKKVKSPSELVISVMRLTDKFGNGPRLDARNVFLAMVNMGQHIYNPPTVEGWHGGLEWSDTGTLVERINFCSEQFGDTESPGVKKMVDSLVSRYSETPSDFIDSCMEILGYVEIGEETKRTLISFAKEHKSEESLTPTDYVKTMLQLITTTREYQLC